MPAALTHQDISRRRRHRLAAGGSQPVDAQPGRVRVSRPAGRRRSRRRRSRRRRAWIPPGRRRRTADRWSRLERGRRHRRQAAARPASRTAEARLVGVQAAEGGHASPGRSRSTCRPAWPRAPGLSTAPTVTLPVSSESRRGLVLGRDDEPKPLPATTLAGGWVVTHQLVNGVTSKALCRRSPVRHPSPAICSRSPPCRA